MLWRLCSVVTVAGRNVGRELGTREDFVNAGRDEGHPEVQCARMQFVRVSQHLYYLSPVSAWSLLITGTYIWVREVEEYTELSPDIMRLLGELGVGRRALDSYGRGLRGITKPASCDEGHYAFGDCIERILLTRKLSM